MSITPTSSPSPCPNLAELHAAADLAVIPEPLTTHLSACAACAAAMESIRADNALAGELARAAAAPSGSRPGPPGPAAELGPGSRIGHYTIQSVLGVGGMGLVYRARQDAPARDVALKLIRAELATPGLVRRFEHEAAALALLRHPGIAQVYEAGTADVGGAARPFMAMELVEGPRLDDFAREGQPERDEVLRLFIRICEAVDHAHRRGVVHRDLKPANILVESDGAAKPRSDGGEAAPAPKILDFGVAKLRDPTLAVEATQAGGFVGTIAYASPEQLAGDPAAIDARTDVYALGVILYELLVGARPYNLDAPLNELIADITAGRVTPPESRGVSLPADLRTVIFKALAPGADRRYQSAALLAEDLRRFLEKRPILARADSTAYVLGKAVARHPYRAAAAAAFVALAMGAAATVFILQSRAVRAEQAKGRVTNSTLAVLGLADLDEPDSPAIASIGEFLDEAGRAVDQQLQGFPAERVELLEHLGRANLGHRRFDQAEPQLQEALALRREHAQDQPLAYAGALNNLGRLRLRQGRLAEAAALFRQSLDLYASSRGGHHADTAEAHYWLGFAQLSLRDYDHATEQLRTAADIQEKLDPASPKLAEYLNGVSASLRATGRFDVALGYAQRALDLAQASPALGADSKAVAVAISNVAANLISLGRFDDAEPLLARALAIREKHYGPDDPRLADTLVIIASLNMRRGQWGETEPRRAYLEQGAAAAQRTLALRTALYKNTDHESVAEALSLLGQIRMRQGRYDDALPALSFALDMRRRLPRHSDGDLGRSESLLGECLTHAGKTEGGRAGELLTGGLDKIRAAFGPTHRHTREALERLLHFYTATGQPEAAAAIQSEIDAAAVPAPTPSAPRRK